MNRLFINLIRDVKYFLKQTDNMTLSWKELVCHGLLVEIGEPSLVKDILKMAMKERFSFLEEEAREFHSENVEPVINIYMSALRSPLGTWGRTAEYTASVLAEETGPFHIKYNNVKKEVRWRRCSLLISAAGA
jgi:hypothetical protein